jgi:hypothetical protein
LLSGPLQIASETRIGSDRWKQFSRTGGLYIDDNDTTRSRRSDRSSRPKNSFRTLPGAGSARTPPIFFKPGDRSECTYEGVGTLINPVVGPQGAGAQ